MAAENGDVFSIVPKDSIRPIDRYKALGSRIWLNIRQILSIIRTIPKRERCFSW